MLTILSPSKTLDFKQNASGTFTTPVFLDESKELINCLKKLTPSEISSLMKLSPNLALLNHKRYQDFKTPFTQTNARQAIYAFKGDVYDGLNAETFTPGNIEMAQKRLRILSGLYGLLRPLDLIQPYRLEMGTRLTNKNGNNLYQFWGNKISHMINQELALQHFDSIINLASQEYAKAMRPATIKATIITPTFKEFKNGTYRMLMLYVKQARGLMAGYIIKNNLHTPEQIKKFNLEGYAFNEKLSTDHEWVFTR